MKTVTLKINDTEVTVPEGTRVIEAARQAGINIPSLCYHPDQKVKANCRMCMVEFEGRGLQAACETIAQNGMHVLTNTKVVHDTQRAMLDLILAGHNQDCLTCARNGNCELQALCRRFGIDKTEIPDASEPKDDGPQNPYILRDESKCIKCERCTEACQLVQNVNVLSHSGRSEHFRITTPFCDPLEMTDCVYCGQCVVSCPVGALTEKDDTQKVWDAINDPSKHVIVQIAPAVRVALGEMFDLPAGSIVTGQMVTALKLLGFDKVFDTNSASDLTLMEEGSELVKRLTEGGTLPMITSCSPGWINYIENYFDGLTDHLSTCKSPQQMFGALSKTYYPEKAGIDPKSVFTVSVMPCIAKKAEADRAEFEHDGIKDVDVVLTTRELAKMIRMAGIDFASLEQSEYDSMMGEGTGAAVIFGTTGGVMEAALRTAYLLVTGKELENIDFKEVRGFKGIKEATIKIGDLDLNVAVAHGLDNADRIMKEIKDGTSKYHFIEIMSCPGGCVGGGGQPIPLSISNKLKRMEAIYTIDRKQATRKSHENKEVQQLYKDYLIKPLGEKSHHLLHTKYYPRKGGYDFSKLKK